MTRHFLYYYGVAIGMICLCAIIPAIILGVSFHYHSTTGVVAGLLAAATGITHFIRVINAQAS